MLRTGRSVGGLQGVAVIARTARFRSRIALTLVGLTLFAFATPARAQSAPDPIAFIGDSTTVTGGDPSPVVVINTSTAALSLTVATDVRQDDGSPIALTSNTASDPSIANLQPGKSATFTLTRTDAAATTTGAGFLLVTVTQVGASGPTAIVKHPLSVGIAKLKPAVTSWKLTSELRDDSVQDRPIPLDSPSNCEGLVDGKTVPGTLNSGSETVTVTGTCQTKSVNGSKASLALAFGPIPRVGTYTGDLTVDGTKVSLELRVSRPIILAIILILIGLTLAFIFHFYVANSYRVGRVAAALEHLDSEAQVAQDAFVQASDGNPWHNYSIGVGARRQAAELVERATKSTTNNWWWWLRSSDDVDADLKSATADGATLKGQIASWPAVADELSALADVDLSPAEQELVTNLWTWRNATLAPEVAARTLEPDEWVKLGTNAAAAAKALGLAKVALELSAAVERYDGADDQLETPDLLILFEARAKKREALAELKRAATPDEVAKLEIQADLDAVRRLLDQLPPVRPAGKAAGYTSANFIAADLPEWVGATLAAAATAPTYTEQTGHLPSPRAIRGWNWALFVIVGFAAIWAGLVGAYFDKAWGTPRDIVTMLLWGFGTTTVLTPVFDALQHLGEGPARLDAAATK